MAIITISRGTFGGGKELAESIAGRLGYRCISREELLTNTASQYVVPEGGLRAALDTKPGLLEGVSLRRIHYIAYVRATLAIIVKDDDVVYHGLVGHLLIKGAPHIFRVRVIADMEFRIKAAVDQHGFSRENAIRLIKKVDCDRARWVRSIYHVDWQDPSLYDLVVDLEHASISNACDMVVEAVETKFQTTPESQKAIDDFVVSTEVRARIAADRGIEDTEVEIEADGDVVTIDGKADSMGEANRIMRVVRETPGIREVKSDLRVRTSGQKDGG